MKHGSRKQVNIVGVLGSPHPNGICSRLLEQCLSQASKEGAEIHTLRLFKIIKDFHPGTLNAKIPLYLERTFKILKKADGILLATPVHWFNISGLMKVFIDWLTVYEMNNFILEGKAVGFISTGEEDGCIQAISLMAAPLSQMGCAIPPHGMFFYNANVTKKSEKAWMLKDARLLGRNLYHFTKMIKTGDEYEWDYVKVKNTLTDQK